MADLSRYARELSSAEYSIFSYIYHELQDQEVARVKIAALVKATGLSQRETHRALKSLAEKEVLQVRGIKGHTAECRLPIGTSAPPAAKQTAPSQRRPAGSGSAPGSPMSASGKSGRSGNQSPGSAAAVQLDRLPQQVFRPCSKEELSELVEVAGTREKLLACLRWFVKMGHSFEPDTFTLFRSAVHHRCNASTAELNWEAPPEDTPAISAGDLEVSTAFTSEDDKQPTGDPEPPQQQARRKNRHSNSFRDQMLRALKEKGFSWPEVERSFRGVFQVIARAIRRGEVIELPGLGIVKAVRRPKPAKQSFRPLYNIATGEKSYKIVDSYRHTIRIVFIPFDKGL